MRRRTRIHLFASRAHKWLALLLGLQLLLWFASGAVMSFFPIDKVHGDHLVDRKLVTPLPPGFVPVSPKGLNRPVEALTARMLLGHPVTEVSSGGTVALFDARTGQPLGTVGPATATAVARQAWRGPAEARTDVEPITAESAEYRGALPAWRVSFADADGTHVYVDAHTGRITAVRTGTWRLYDFFWGLHIMDWKNHENFNSPWLLAFAIGGLLLWIGGATLLAMRWPRRRRPRTAMAPYPVRPNPGEPVR